jgi:hypothetical protein
MGHSVIDMSHQLHLIAVNAWDCHPVDEALVFRNARRGPKEHDRFFRYEGDSTRGVGQDEFLAAKFGPAYKAILSSFGREPDSVSRALDGSVAACYFAESIVRIFGPVGQSISEVGPGSRGRSGHLLYGVALSDIGIWAAYPSDNTVVLYLMDGTEGSVLSSIFSYPEHLAIIDGTLYVCDTGNRRICHLDQQTLQVTELHTLEKSVWEYLRAGSREIVRLQSGIYELTKAA